MGFLWVLTVTAAVAGASSAGGLRAASGGDDGDGGRHLAAKPKKETSSKVCKGGKEKGTCEDLGCQWNKCAPWASKKKGKNKKKKGKAKKIPSPTASPTVDEHDSAGEHDFVITGKLRLGDFNSESTEDTVAFMNLVAPFASDGHMVVTKEESAVQRNGQVSFDMVFSLGSVSGAHLNPAVSTALLLSGRGVHSVGDYFPYVVSQLAGGLVAGLTYAGITGISFPLGHGTGYSWADVTFAEFTYTFVLCFTVLNVACTTMPEKLMGGGPSNQIYGWAIGMCIMVGAGATGNVSGACLNPAVALPIDVLAKDGFKMTSLGYTGVEFLAAGLAAGGMMAVRPAEFAKGAKKPIL